MSDPIFIVGAGGFGREVFSILAALGERDGHRHEVSFIDDNPSDADLDLVARLGSRVAGTVELLVGRSEPSAVVIAVGSPTARAHILSRLASAPVTFPTLVHPDATVGIDVHLSEGVVIAAGARLSTAIRVGKHVHIDQNVTVGHDTVLGDLCRLNPQACISGAVRIGDGALVGASATVLQGLEVGARSVVGAGAVVTRPVAAGVTVKGVPAR